MLLIKVDFSGENYAWLCRHLEQEKENEIRVLENNKKDGKEDLVREKEARLFKIRSVLGDLYGTELD